MEIILNNNEQAQRFETRIDGQLAYLEYKVSGDTIYLTHLFVPPSLRGQGIAAEITRQAIASINAQGLEIVPVCPYVITYMQRHGKE